jgi:hypothetical protein
MQGIMDARYARESESPWARLLAYVAGRINQELLLRMKYLGVPVNRHGSEDARASRERSSNPLGPEFALEVAKCLVD